MVSDLILFSVQGEGKYHYQYGSPQQLALLLFINATKNLLLSFIRYSHLWSFFEQRSKPPFLLLYQCVYQSLCVSQCVPVVYVYVYVYVCVYYAKCTYMVMILSSDPIITYINS